MYRFRLKYHARTINELNLQDIVVRSINELLYDKSKCQEQLHKNIAAVIRGSAETSTDGIDEKLMSYNNKKAYDEIADWIFILREQCQQCTVDTAARDAQIARINDLQDFIITQPIDLTEFVKTLVKRWHKQITVWQDHFTAELKSGLRIDIKG